MAGNPVDLVYVDGVAVAKSDVRGYEKLRVRQRVADADEVRNTDFSGQFGGLYVAALNADFNIDTTDTTTADDGVNCIRDFAGNGFFRVAVVFSEVEKVIIATGDVTIADDDATDNFIISNTSGGPINVYWPSAAVRTKKMSVTDNGNAGMYPITNLPKSGSGQTLMTGSSYVLDVNGMGLALKPRADGSGWY